MVRIILIIFIGVVLNGCDNHLYTQFFNNPSITSVGTVDVMEKDKWYDFYTDIKALNRNQNIVVEFFGSDPEKISIVDSDVESSDDSLEKVGGGKTLYLSTSYPDVFISVDVMVKDLDNVWHEFEASGLSTGIILNPKAEIDLIGKSFTHIKVKSNVTISDVDIKWISYTGK